MYAIRSYYGVRRDDDLVEIARREPGIGQGRTGGGDTTYSVLQADMGRS